MKSSFSTKLWFTVVVVITLSFLTSNPVSAHERRMIDKYEVIVGFIVEPAFEGLKNGVDLRVQLPAESEAEEPTPVEGLEETLQVEVTHVPSGESKTMNLRTIFRDPGHYTADLIPTAPGQYRFRFFGTIEGLEVDETFESGPGRFGDIQSSGDLQFPEKLPEIREIEGAVRGVQDTASQAEDAAIQAQNSVASTNTLAIVGIVLGVIGTVSGVGAIVMGRRQR